MSFPLGNILGAPENWLLIAFVALLLFGKRLPEVGKSLGKGITEFKKGLAGIDEEVEQNRSASPKSSVDQAAIAGRTAPSLPAEYKFDPYTGKPVQKPAEPQMRFDPYTGKPLNEAQSNT